MITGTRLTAAGDARTPATVDRVSARGLPPGPSAAATLVRRLPGVSAFDDQGTRAQPTLDVRGFTVSPVVGVAQGVSVFLDGVRVNEADAQQVNFDLLPVEAVDDVELVRGPTAVHGKNTLAGAIDLHTKRGDDASGAELETEAGAFGYRGARLSLGGVHDGVDGYVMGRAARERGWRDATAATRAMLFGTVGRRGADGASDVALSVLVARDSMEQAGSLPASWIAAGPALRRANYTPGDYAAPALVHVAVRGQHALLGGTGRANAFVRANRTAQFNVNEGDASTLARVRTASVGGTAEWSRRVGARHPLDITTGAELARHRVGYHVFQVASGDAAPEGDCEITADASTALCEDARVAETDAAAYAQLRLAIAPTVTATADARADVVRLPFTDLRDDANSATNAFHALSPKLGVAWTPAAAARAWASVGRGFRAPAALELACADPASPCPLPFSLGDDPPLKPVRVTSWELGAEWRAGRLTSRAAAFRSDVRDEIFLQASERTAGYFQNLPHTRRDGVELSAEAALPNVRWLGAPRAGASYSLVDARFESAAQLASALPDAVGVRPGDRMPLSPRHRATAHVGATRLVGRAVLDGELTATAVSRQFLRGDEGNTLAPLPGYGVADLRLGASVGHVELSAFLTNVLDRRYVSFGTFGPNDRAPSGAELPNDRVERFLTPGYPRGVEVSVTVRR